MQGTLYGEIHRQLIASPSAICIVWPENNHNSIKINSRLLLGFIEQYVSLLQNKKATEVEQVLIAAAPSPKIIAAILAVMRTGGTAVLPPAGANIKSLLHIIREQNIKKIIVNEQPGFLIKLLCKVLGIQIISFPNQKTNQHFTEDFGDVNGHGALMSYSSGSTGSPKKIHRPYDVLYAQHLAIKKAFPPNLNQVDFPLFPNIVLHNLACGVTSVLPNIPSFNITMLEPETILQQIEMEKVQTLTGNVFYFKKLLQYLSNHPKEYIYVSALGIGGSPVPEQLIPALTPFFPEATFYIIYGSSEAEPIAVRKHEEIQDPGYGYFVGMLVDDVQVKIIPLGEILLPNGKREPVGEIAVKGNHVAIANKEDWLPTGDFGYLKGNRLWLTGRKGNERLHNGIQHYQVEHCLSQIPGIERVAARSDRDGFILFIQGKADETDIKKSLHAKNIQINVIDIIFSDELPVDRRHHSKIRYELLK